MTVYLYDGWRFTVDRFDAEKINSERLWNLYY